MYTKRLQFLEFSISLLKKTEKEYGVLCFLRVNCAKENFKLTLKEFKI